MVVVVSPAAMLGTEAEGRLAKSEKEERDCSESGVVEGENSGS